jgi:hypothetical protein
MIENPHDASLWRKISDVLELVNDTGGARRIREYL